MFGFNNKRLLNNPIFGEMRYIEWWQAILETEVVLWGKRHRVEILVLADKLDDGVTKEQENSYIEFKNTLDEKQKIIQDLLEQYHKTTTTNELAERFFPTQLIFSRNGDYGICIDDTEDEDCSIQPDSGLAISFVPEIKLYQSQDEYVAFIF